MSHKQSKKQRENIDNIYPRKEKKRKVLERIKAYVAVSRVQLQNLEFSNKTKILRNDRKGFSTTINT